jgi:hypothetical protein
VINDASAGKVKTIINTFEFTTYVMIEVAQKGAKSGDLEAEAVVEATSTAAGAVIGGRIGGYTTTAVGALVGTVIGYAAGKAIDLYNDFKDVYDSDGGFNGAGQQSKGYGSARVPRVRTH